VLWPAAREAGEAGEEALSGRRRARERGVVVVGRSQGMRGVGVGVQGVVETLIAGELTLFTVGALYLVAIDAGLGELLW
jgi:hypothetical protein